MKAVISALSFAVLLALGSCTSEAAAPTQEGLLKQTVGVMDKVVDELGKVTNAETAKTAEAAISPLLAQLKTLGEAMKKFGEPSKELMAKFKPQMDAIMQKGKEFAGKMMTNPELMKVFASLQPKLEEAMKMLPQGK